MAVVVAAAVTAMPAAASAQTCTVADCPAGFNVITGSGTITGTNGNDCIIGSDGDDTINGLSGNDYICGGAGNDTIDGGQGDDEIYGEDGDDTLDGGQGDDYVNGGAGNDTVDGGSGADHLQGGPGDDTLIGDSGDDVIGGGGGDDTFDGGSGNDSCPPTEATCETASFATLSSVVLDSTQKGAELRWQTSVQIGTVGFYVWCQKPSGWMQVTPALVASDPTVTDHERYRADVSACAPTSSTRFKLEEVNIRGQHVVRDVTLTDPTQAPDLSPSILETAISTVHDHAFTHAAAGPVPRQDATATLAVTESGVTLIDYARLAEVLGASEAEVTAAAQSGSLRLSFEGQPLTWLARDDGVAFYLARSGDIFRPYDAVEIALDAGAPMAELSSDGIAPGPVRTTTAATYHREENSFAATAVTQDPDIDYWYWAAVSATEPAYQSATLTALPPHAVSGTEATVRVRLRGANTENRVVEHQIQFGLGGTPIGETRFAALDASETSMTVDVDAIEDAAGAFTVTAELPTNMTYSAAYIDAIDIDYQRELVLDGRELRFTADAGDSVHITGISDPDVLVLALGDSTANVTGWSLVPDADGLALELVAPVTGDYVVGAPTAVSDDALWTNPPSTLRSTANAADYVVITVPSLLDQARRLARYRADQGLVPRVVLVQEIYDDFAAGNPDPNALHRFLAYAHDSWARAPRYAVITGKGNFDYRDLWQVADNLVPPVLRSSYQGLASSDLSLGDVDPGAPGFEISVGRLPAQTGDELSTLIDKIEAFETRWSNASAADRAALLIAESDPSVDFTSANLSFQERIATSPVTVLSLSPTTEARQALTSVLDGSSHFLVNFVGHGGITQAGSSPILSTDDAWGLTNETPFIFSAASCLMGRFEYPGLTSLAEALVLNPSGGAVASFTSSALSIHEDAEVLFREVLGDVYAPGGRRLGDRLALAARDFLAQNTASGDSLLYTYNLLGDPALLIAPPSGPTGTSAGGDVGADAVGAAASSGGCAAGGSGAPLAGLVLGAWLVALAARRRRLSRRRAA